jgi:hypothetical protein
MQQTVTRLLAPILLEVNAARQPVRWTGRPWPCLRLEMHARYCYCEAPPSAAVGEFFKSSAVVF